MTNGDAGHNHGKNGRGTLDLRAIAREAMIARGMLPEFSADVLREVAAIEGSHGLDGATSSDNATAAGTNVNIASNGPAKPGGGAAVRDLRNL